jgi:hypothetical protein
VVRRFTYATGWVPAHADDDDPVEGGVGLVVAAPVEAVPSAGFAGSGRDGAGATQFGGSGGPVREDRPRRSPCGASRYHRK